MPATIATKANKNSMPTYRRRKGYKDAIVTLTDAVTGKRKDCYVNSQVRRLCRIFKWGASHEMNRCAL